MKSVKLNKQYQITVPKEIRKKISINPGDMIEMLINEKKEIVICKIKKNPLEDSFGVWKEKRRGIDFVNRIRDESEQRMIENGIE